MIRKLSLISTFLLSACSIEATDKDMIVHFEQNRNAFQELVGPKSDCLTSNKPGPVCLKLMKQLSVFSVGNEPFIKGAVSIDFKSFETENKGYLYSKSEAVKPLYENLDKMPSGLNPYQKGYKKISKNWYIFYEHLN